MTSIELKFIWQQDTKGACRYGEMLPSGKVASAPNDPGAVVGTLYLRKTTFPDGKFPKELSVTINH